ncbi:MAG TPA: lamin tail domain-containing protein, partial [Saprospiraceae bacterium]|nr:lamin tail domain-containing protein [Saprospiraceae bacterium]
DDDSYVYKGKMDYYVYQDAETGRLTPYDYDGNSAMETNFVSWSPFYNETKVNYPLLNKLLAVPNLRQRYLAHMRTLITEGLDTSQTNAVFNTYRAMIDTIVKADVKKSYTYAQFGTEVQNLKNFIQNRKNYLLSNTEVNKLGPSISTTEFYVDNTAGQAPLENQEVLVRTKVQHAEGINLVNLYVSSGLYGKFTKQSMYDDGQHQDGAANDGVYGANIQAFPNGTWVRYYIEATAANTAKSISYDPVGAEHDVFIYKVVSNEGKGEVVINEIMASNKTVVQDEAGDYDDWIELYNRSNLPVNLENYALSDEPNNLQKWKIPSGAILGANNYLIIWADEDQTQGALHANFKLSGDGERITLSNSSGDIIDSLTYGIQTEDKSWSRIPNGSGSFIIKNPTFGGNNQPTATINILSGDNPILVYPNPANNYIIINTHENKEYELDLYNCIGQKRSHHIVSNGTMISTEDLASGLYYISCNAVTTKFVIHH